MSLIDRKPENKRWISVAVLLVLAGMVLTACGDDDGLDEGDDDDGRDPGGDTSAYSGQLAWSHDDGGEGSGIRVWSLDDSEYMASVTQNENGDHLAPALSSDEGALSYTSEAEALGPHELSQAQYLELQSGELVGVPWEMGQGRVRASLGSDMDYFASVVSFAERVYDEASGELERYGAGVWVVGDANADSLAESNAPVYCTQMDPDAALMIFNAGDGLYRVATTGGNPQALAINHPSLEVIETEPVVGGRCAFKLANDGNRLSFIGQLEDSGEPAAFVHDLDSGQTLRVAEPVEMELVDWQMAGNGNQGVLLFRGEDPSEDLQQYSLRTVNLVSPGATTEIEVFEVEAEADIQPTAAISDNGMVIARSGYDEDGVHVVVMGASGDEPRRIQGNAETMGDGMLGLTF
ncbi:hypothetical protein J2T60_002452 [Natronospira proteinivora]|uniref:WD40 repeat protein n=1 Tax=Natronospira proteinivora TaxID=1807133 RepID=A0ABT1GES6_9GAMM|nr:hypothetical protein [Natronospira proteinivora]MCP1728452.1 hypothetical protein [Natronospira proteinivora]